MKIIGFINLIAHVLEIVILDKVIPEKPDVTYQIVLLRFVVTLRVTFATIMQFIQKLAIVVLGVLWAFKQQLTLKARAHCGISIALL